MDMHTDTILVTGACGQIGSELVLALRKLYKTVIASDLKEPQGELLETGPYERLDVLHKPGLEHIIQQYSVSQIYHLAAILSATGEKNPEFAWRVNMKGLRNILDVSVEHHIEKVFFPSTIAVFGPTHRGFTRLSTRSWNPTLSTVSVSRLESGGQTTTTRSGA